MDGDKSPQPKLPGLPNQQDRQGGPDAPVSPDWLGQPGWPDRKDLEDAELIEGLIRRQPWAFTAAYERYRVRIYTFLIRLCGRRELAEDLFQDTFLQLARHADQLRPDTELGGFLFTVARNRYRSHRRTSLFRRLRLQLFTLGKEEEGGVSATDTPFEHAAHGDLGRRLEQAIRRLGEGQREVLLLVGIEGMDQDRAAKVLGLSPAALRQRLSRARAEVQEYVKEFLDKDFSDKAASASSKMERKGALQPTLAQPGARPDPKLDLRPDLRPDLNRSTTAKIRSDFDTRSQNATIDRGGSDENEPARQELAPKRLRGR